MRESRGIRKICILTRGKDNNEKEKTNGEQKTKERKRKRRLKVIKIQTGKE